MGSETCPLTPRAEFERQVAILRSVRTIAVVGMSANPDRPSKEVGLFLRDRGYAIAAVNPGLPVIPGVTVVPDLTRALQALGTIDLVDLFVAGERIPPILEEARALGVKRIWFQPGAEHPESERRARELGMEVVTRACTLAVLKRAG